MAMHVGDKIALLRKELGLTQKQLAEKSAGVAQQTIEQLENKKNRSCRKMHLIAKALGVPLELLIDENITAEELKPDTFRHSAPTTLARTNARDSAVMLRQYDDVAGSMGNGLTLRDQPGQITEWMVTPEWANKNIPANSGKQNLRIVTGFGDSMRGMFNSGDPLIVDIGVKSVEYDAVYFFRVGNEGFIKRLQRVPGKGLLAISENKAYESWPITDDMDFECFGRVLKAWKSEEF